MRISPISFKANDDNIFGKVDITSTEWVNSTDDYNDINEWKAFCKPLIEDTFEKVKPDENIQNAT